MAKRWQSRGVMNTSDVSGISHSEPEATQDKYHMVLEKEIIFDSAF